ncbi:MAG TPA: hypothetical protein VHO46_15200 [Bacteroidales bacterium]|nr:hypothetical protein [Bacteroidales bacterium]
MVKKDTIILRWSPVSVPVWQVGINSGYVIKKYTIARKGNFISDGLNQGKLLTDEPIKPESNTFFEKLSLTDKRALILQEAIYGTDFRLPTTADFNSSQKAFQEIEVRFGFALFICDLSPMLAKAAGLSFIDTGISNDERYVYSISPVNVPDGLQIDPAVIVVDADKITELPPVYDVQAVFLDKAVKFSWPIIFHKGIYSAYTIEKSSDGKSFSPISELPLVNFSENPDQDNFTFIDSLVSNDRKFYYRIKGISPFGMAGPPSAIIEGKGVAEFSAYATIDTAIINENGRIVIKWRITENKASPVLSINVLRSDNYNDSYENISRKPLDKGTRSFTDEKPGYSNYYKLKLTGKDNLESYSFPYFVQTEDNEPPAAPQMLSGKVDSTGIVSLVWKQNIEPDLLGYKIFRGNSPEDEFIALGKEMTPNNYCNDTINLNTLTPKIYYQVVAVDRNFNSSEYSMLLDLTRPDTIAPAPAILTKISHSEGRVKFEMEESPSRDISYYDLSFKTGDDTVTFNVRTWNKLPVYYEDLPVIHGQNLQYTLETVDLAGNKSENTRTIFIPSEAAKSLILTAEQSSDGERILLSWITPVGFDPVKTMIYRGVGDAPISLYVTEEKPLQFFTDEKIEMNTRYTYKVLQYNALGSLCAGNLIVNPLLKIKSK